MKKNQNNLILGAVVVLVLVVGLLFSGLTAGSVALSSQTFKYDATQSAFITTAVMTGDGLNVQLNPVEGINSAGQRVVPENKPTIVTLSNTAHQCVLPLSSSYTLPPKSYYSKAFGKSVNFPGLVLRRGGDLVQTKAKYTVAVKQSGLTLQVATLDAANPQDEFVFNDVRNDGGSLKVKGFGATRGAFACENTGDVAFLQETAWTAGTFVVASQSQVFGLYDGIRNACGPNLELVPPDDLLSAVYKSPQQQACLTALDGFMGASIRQPNGFGQTAQNIALGASTATWQLPLSVYAVIQIVADGNFYQSALFSTTTPQADPVIVGTNPVSLTTSSTGLNSLQVTLKNQASTAGRVTGTLQAGKGSATSTFADETLQAGQSKTYSVSYTAPMVTSPSTDSILVQACAPASDFSTTAQKCVSLPVSVQVNPLVTPTPLPPQPDKPGTEKGPGYSDTSAGNFWDDVRLSRLFCGAPKPTQADVIGLKFEIPDFANAGCVSFIRFAAPILLAVIVAFALGLIAVPPLFALVALLLSGVFILAFNFIDQFWLPLVALAVLGYAATGQISTKKRRKN